jgi:hypothetical protein
LWLIKPLFVEITIVPTPNEIFVNSLYDIQQNLPGVDKKIIFLKLGVPFELCFKKTCNLPEFVVIILETKPSKKSNFKNLK